MTYSTTITSKGQITLPADLRAKLKLLPGRKVNVRLDGKRLVIDAPSDINDVRARNQVLMQRAGIDHVTDTDIDRAVGDAVIERYQRGVK